MVYDMQPPIAKHVTDLHPMRLWNLGETLIRVLRWKHGRIPLLHAGLPIGLGEQGQIMQDIGFGLDQDLYHRYQGTKNFECSCAIFFP